MCKFNNRLFVFTLYCLFGLVCVSAKPLQESRGSSVEDFGALVALSALMNSQDVHYDQRQKGEENYRISLDGFFVGLPQEESSALLLLTDDMIESLDDDNLLAFGKNKPAAAVAPPASYPSSALNKSAAVNNTPSVAESQQSISSDPTPMLIEIPASRKYLEARQSVDAVSKTKSYISHFLNLLKRVREH